MYNAVFTFYCLIKQDDVYVARPYVTLYNDMVEIASLV